MKFEIVKLEPTTIEVNLDDEFREVENLAEEAIGIEVVDQESLNKAGSCLQKLKAVKTLIEEKYNPYLDAVKKAKAMIESMRKTIVQAIEESTYKISILDRELRAKVNLYYVKIEEERKKAEEEKRKAEEKLQKEKESGSVSVESVLATIVEKPEIPKAKGVHQRTVWKYRASDEPLDPAYTTKDELGFVIPDHPKIRKEVQEKKENTKIQGVYVYSEIITVVN